MDAPNKNDGKRRGILIPFPVQSHTMPIQPENDKYPGYFGVRCAGCGSYIDDEICNCGWDHAHKIRYR